MKTHADEPPPETGGGAGGGARMGRDDTLGCAVVRTPDWEASKEKSRCFHPDDSPRSAGPDVLVLLKTDT